MYIIKFSQIFTYPLWLFAHIFQSEKLRNLFLKWSAHSSENLTPAGLIKVKELDASEVDADTFKTLIYKKEPLLIRGLANPHKENPIIDHKYLIQNYGNFKTTPRVADARPVKELTIKEILTQNQLGDKKTIASPTITKEKKLIDDIQIAKWIPEPSILNSPLLNNTLFVSSEGFCTGLHMEAGRLLNVQLSGKKTWYLINPKYSHILKPLLSKTTIHFSDIVNSVSDITEKLVPKIPVYNCTVKEGDVLLIPPFFWHTVFTEEKTVSTTYQWLTLFKPFFENPFMSLFLLTSRNPSVLDVLIRREKK